MTTITCIHCGCKVNTVPGEDYVECLCCGLVQPAKGPDTMVSTEPGPDKDTHTLSYEEGERTLRQSFGRERIIPSPPLRSGLKSPMAHPTKKGSTPSDNAPRKPLSPPNPKRKRAPNALFSSYSAS